MQQSKAATKPALKANCSEFFISFQKLRLMQNRKLDIKFHF